MEELKVFIVDVKAAMLKAFNEYMKKIDSLASRNGAEIEAQYHRLKNFEDRNIEDPTNS